MNHPITYTKAQFLNLLGMAANALLRQFRSIVVGKDEDGGYTFKPVPSGYDGVVELGEDEVMIETTTFVTTNKAGRLSATLELPLELIEEIFAAIDREKLSGYGNVARYGFIADTSAPTFHYIVDEHGKAHLISTPVEIQELQLQPLADGTYDVTAIGVDGSVQQAINATELIGGEKVELNWRQINIGSDATPTGLFTYADEQGEVQVMLSTNQGMRCLDKGTAKLDIGTASLQIGAMSVQLDAKPGIDGGGIDIDETQVAFIAKGEDDKTGNGLYVTDLGGIGNGGVATKLDVELPEWAQGIDPTALQLQLSGGRAFVADKTGGQLAIMPLGATPTQQAHTAR